MIKTLLIGLLVALLMSVMLLAASVIRNTELKYTTQNLREENAGLVRELEAVRYSMELDSTIDSIDVDEWLRENDLLRAED